MVHKRMKKEKEAIREGKKAEIAYQGTVILLCFFLHR